MENDLENLPGQEVPPFRLRLEVEPAADVDPHTIHIPSDEPVEPADEEAGKMGHFFGNLGYPPLSQLL